MYVKFGPDALGRIVEQPTVDGNLVILPHRPTPKQTLGAVGLALALYPEVKRGDARRVGNLIMFPRL